MIRQFLLCLILVSAACQSFAAPTATPTATVTSSPTATVTASNTPTPTASATATLTPSATNTPTPSQTPSITPTASLTPLPEVGFVFDHWNAVDIPESISGGIGEPMIAFINQNDRDGIGDVRTPQPATNKQTLYFGSASNPGVRTPILAMDASTEDQVYVAAPGNAVAYFVTGQGGDLNGLYILDLTVGLSGRVLPIDSLVQRGFVSEPAWSPDGSELAIMLATAYATDIFAVGRDGTNARNLTNSGAYDLWPSWSPNGRYLLFVSDRAQCPSWTPGEAGACDALSDPAPTGGNPYILELGTGEVTKLSDRLVTEAPQWINSRLVAFGSGDPALGDTQRLLYTVDIVSGVEQQTRLLSGPASQTLLDEAWAPDGSAVVYQDASGAANPVMLIDSAGNLIGEQDELNLPRYGMKAAWAPDGSKIAIGGLNGNCPYGARVLDASFNFIAHGNPPPSMCDPTFSPDGTLLTFTGVNPIIDGRVDVYVANNNGFGAVNLTGDLRGQIHLLGWVG